MHNAYTSVMYYLLTIDLHKSCYYFTYLRIYILDLLADTNGKAIDYGS